jgi:hypothetical protein
MKSLSCCTAVAVPHGVLPSPPAILDAFLARFCCSSLMEPELSTTTRMSADR